jgi:hypothetical protein
MITAILLVISLFMIIKTTLNYAKKDIQFGEFFLWIIAWTGLTVLSIMPWISTFFAEYVGLTRGTDLVLILSVILLFYLNYGLHKRLDDQQKDLTNLTRKLSRK